MLARVAGLVNRQLRRAMCSAPGPMENIERLRFYQWLADAEYDGPVGLTAKFTLDEDKVPTFLDIMRENIAFTRRERGMLLYDLTPDYEQANVYFLLERFASRSALLAHIQSKHYARCQERFLSEMGGHPIVQICFYRQDPVEPSADYLDAAARAHPSTTDVGKPTVVTAGAGGIRKARPPAVVGKTVVVTGGAGGIGLGIASALAAHGCCTVYLLDRVRSEVEQSAIRLQGQSPGTTIVGIECDVRDEQSVLAAAAAVSTAATSLDVLVNCAGVTARMPVEQMSLAEYDRVAETNTRGVWLTSMAFGALLRAPCGAGRAGTIINVDSFVTHSPLKHVVAYAMSKAGLQALTRGLALEWGPSGVRVNGIAPGLIRTSISAAMWDRPNMQRWATQQTPLGRLGTVEDVVGAACFLASPDAAFITGQTIRVDGGLSSGLHWPIDELPQEVTPLGGSVAAAAMAHASTRQARGTFYYHAPPSKAGHATEGLTLQLPANPFEAGGLETNLQAGTVSPYTHTVQDGRQDSALQCPSGGSLAHRGMCLLSHQSALAHQLGELLQPTTGLELGSAYDAEIVALAKALTGADRVVLAARVVRRVGGARGEQGAGVQGAGVRGGAFLAHGDFCDSFMAQLEEQALMTDARSPLLTNLLDAAGLGISDATALRRGRLIVLNFWRPLGTDPVVRAPMAVCDATSMRGAQLHVFAHLPDPPPKNYQLPLPNLLTVASNADEHRWIYFPSMTRDEVLTFKTYDSRGSQPSNGVGVHAAFEDDAIDPLKREELARESVESRVLCFFAEGTAVAAFERACPSAHPTEA